MTFGDVHPSKPMWIHPNSQEAYDFIHLYSIRKNIWQGHTCNAFATCFLEIVWTSFMSRETVVSNGISTLA